MKKAYARKSADNISVIVIKFIKPKAKPKPKPNYDLTSNTYEWLKWSFNVKLFNWILIRKFKTGAEKKLKNIFVRQFKSQKSVLKFFTCNDKQRS